MYIDYTRVKIPNKIMCTNIFIHIDMTSCNTYFTLETRITHNIRIIILLIIIIINSIELNIHDN